VRSAVAVLSFKQHCADEFGLVFNFSHLGSIGFPGAVVLACPNQFFRANLVVGGILPSSAALKFSPLRSSLLGEN